MTNEYLFFTAFLIFIAIVLSVDLGLFNKKDRIIRFREAALLSAMWVVFALVFYVFIRTNGHLLHGIDSFEKLKEVCLSHHHAITLIPGDYERSLSLYDKNLSLEFITGYLIEYALSVDNIFVIVLVFTAFSVDARHYHRVLFWGILGAVLMRFFFIFTGGILINRFEWLLYILGAFLVYTGVRMFISGDEEEKIDTENHPVIRFTTKYFRVHPSFVGNKFFVRINHKRLITPLFIVLLIIEFTDLLFAVDSIPAIFAVTKDPYIVFFSNIFAILGLRSMFFFLVNIIHKFSYLKTGLAFILTFVGLKMLGEHWLQEWGFTTTYSLYVILGILTVSVLSSLFFPKGGEKKK